MSFPPKARVVVTPYAGPERRGRVVSKVSDVEAYVIRFHNGDRHTVPAHHVKSNAKGENDDA